MFRSTLRIECGKALRNRLFWFSVPIGTTITFLSLVPQVKSYYASLRFMNSLAGEYAGKNPHAPMVTLFNRWIGGECYSLGEAVYFFVFPLLVAIPYGWSYCYESRSGYIRSAVLRSGRAPYFYSKYIAVFLSGGLAMVIPLLLNFLLTAMFIPAVRPEPSYVVWYGVNGSSLLSAVYYSRPFLYVFLYLLIDFLYGGLVACMSYALSAVCRNRIVVVLLPFVVLLGFKYICTSLIYTDRVRYKELSPLSFLHPAAATYDTTWLVVIAEAVILFLFTFLLACVKEKNHEIY